jgi:hypothetical protein
MEALNLLVYAPKNRSSPWVITGKELSKNPKTFTGAKKKACSTPQIKTTKRSLENRLTPPGT